MNRNQKAVAERELSGYDNLRDSTLQWKSDVAFFQDELHFLKDLLNKYFMLLIKTESLKYIKELDRDVCRAIDCCAIINEKVDLHLKNVNVIIALASEPQFSIWEEHDSVRSQIRVFVSYFRDQKQKMYRVTSRMLDHEKLRLFLRAMCNDREPGYPPL